MTQPLRTLALTSACLVMTLATAGCTIPGGTRTPGVTVPPSGSPAPAVTTASATTSPAPSPDASGAASASSAAWTPTTVASTPASTASSVPTPWWPSSSPGASPSAGDATPATTASAPPTASTTISVRAGEPRSLGIADAASAVGWVQGGFQPVGSAYVVESLSTQVGCNAVAAPLEFRFAGVQGSATFAFAQSVDSPSSAEKVTWSIVADGQLLQTTTTRFTEQAELTVPLAGARVVQVQAANPSPCTGTATGVITKALVTG